MTLWLVSTLVSWLVSAGVLSLICRARPVIVHVPPDWRAVAAVATLAHVVASAIVYAPLVRVLQPRVPRPATCVITAVAGVLPWLAVMAWRVRDIDGALAAALTPEGLLVGAFLVIASGGFGLLRHERDLELVILERRLAEAERRLHLHRL